VFVLRDIEELSTQETAETLGLTLPAVQARLHRARLQLRATLGPILSCRQRSSELRVDDDLRIRVARPSTATTMRKYAIIPQKPIRIIVDKGHVTLYSVVDNKMDKQIAETQARAVSGTFSVENKLAVAKQK
jgi:hypothetical protein